MLDYLADELPMSKSRIKEAMLKGAVWMKRGDDDPFRLRRAKEPIKLNDEVHIYYDEDFLAIKPPHLQCIDDQGQFSIWAKPAGLLDTVSLYGDHLSLERALLRDLPQERDCYFIDPAMGEITGLMLVVHTRVAAAKVEDQYTHHKVLKNFQATLIGDYSSRSLPVLNIDNRELTIELVDYQSYSDTSVIEIGQVSGSEDSLMTLLHENGLVTHEESELFCSKLSFFSPITDLLVEYRL